jgi:alanine racemase
VTDAALFPGRPTAARVRLDAVAENFRLVTRVVGPAEVCAVVKANAYGHGAVPVARRLEEAGCRRFAVALLEEGVELREAGISAEVLLLQGVAPGQVPEVLAHGLVPVLSSLAALELASEAAGSAALPLHVKFDTGMGRLGLAPEQAGEVCELLRGRRNLELVGVCTHFARAGECAHTTREQLTRFDDVRAALRGAGFRPGLVHAANSAACFSEPAARYDCVRVGLALYGAHPEPGLPHAEGLRPALAWTTALDHVRRVPAGSPISYGGTFVTSRPSALGLVPVGYADGYRRALGNRASVLVRGRRAPVVGRVCMDLAVLDLTDVPGAAPGDEAVLIGAQGDDAIPVEEVASWLDTIPYEVLCGIGPRVPRVYEAP